MKILKEKKFKIKVPKTILIGDPLYLEDFSNDKKKLNSLVYNKETKNSDLLVGFAKVFSYEDSFEYNNDIIPYKSTALLISFGSNDRLAEVYLCEKCLASQKVQNMEIGVDSAKYIIGIDDKEISINTGGDGLWGNIYEYRSIESNKLQGIYISLDAGEYTDFEDMLKYVEYLFDVV